MAKKSHWPWILSLVVIGLYFGSEVAENIKTAPPERQQNSTKSEQKQAVVPTPRPAELVDTTKQELGIKIKQRTMYVDANRLNVRDGPDTSYKQIWTLKRDEAVAVIRAKEEWRFVRGGRFEGWVHGGYLTPKPTPKKPIVRKKPTPSKPVLSDAKIREILIERSIALYRGSCPCPYNRTRNGSRCGKRSAYSRPGGASPLCYDRDISAAMVAEYRARQ